MSHEIFDLLWSKALYNYKELLLFTSSSCFIVSLMKIVVSNNLWEEKKKTQEVKVKKAVSLHGQI